MSSVSIISLKTQAESPADINRYVNGTLTIDTKYLKYQEIIKIRDFSAKSLTRYVSNTLLGEDVKTGAKTIIMQNKTTLSTGKPNEFLISRLSLKIRNVDLVSQLLSLTQVNLASMIRKKGRNISTRLSKYLSFKMFDKISIIKDSLQLCLPNISQQGNYCTYKEKGSFYTAFFKSLRDLTNYNRMESNLKLIISLSKGKQALITSLSKGKQA